MMWKGEVVSIYLATKHGEALLAVGNVSAVPAKGLKGDRHFKEEGTAQTSKGREVSLVESEALEALERDYQIELAPGESRRSIVTKGVPLNHLRGKTFRVGPVILKGALLSHPCQHLEELTKEGVRDGLIHRGGLLCFIVQGGTISVGDRMEPVEK